MYEEYKGPIATGGLMRCCLDTVLQLSPAEPEEESRLECLHCQNEMVFRGGRWQWDRDKILGRTQSVSPRPPPRSVG